MRRAVWLGTLSLVAGAAGCFILVDPDDYADAATGGSGVTSTGTTGTPGATTSTGSAGGSGGCESSSLQKEADQTWQFGTAEQQSLIASAVGADGTVYLVGLCKGDVPLPGGATITCGSSDSMFVSKLGRSSWTVLLVSQSFAANAAIAVSPSGAVWVAGGFGGVATQTISSGNCMMHTSNGGFDGFLARFRSDGACEYLETLGDASYQVLTDVAPLDGGAVAITGRFNGSSVLGGEDINAIKQDDVFVLRLDLAGTAIWKRDLGGGQASEPVRLASHAGRLVVAGTFIGEMDCCGGPATDGGGRDVFVAAMDPANGTVGQSRLFGGPLDEILDDVVVAADGAPTILGDFASGDLNLGGTVLHAAADHEMFLAGLAPDFTTIYALDEDGLVAGGALALDPASGDVAFATTSGATLAHAPTAQGYDVYAGLVGCGGTLRWIDRFGDGETQGAAGVSLDSTGGLTLAGGFYGTIDFAPEAPLTTMGNGDVFVAHLVTKTR